MSDPSSQNKCSNQALFNNGWLSTARVCQSPNFNERPKSTEVNLLVIHNISLPPEQFGDGYIEQFFCNHLDHRRHPYFKKIQSLKVSSHFLITRNGQVIQFVSTDKRAWHAGKSHYEGRDECNDFSIGIELEGADTIPYSDEQYTSLVALTQQLIQHYPELNSDTIVGHDFIAPGRKTDPGPAFKWENYFSMLSQ